MSSLSSRRRCRRRSSGPSKTSRWTAMPAPPLGDSEPNRFPDLLHFLLGDLPCPFRSFRQDLPDRDAALDDRLALLREGGEHLFHVAVHPLLALDAADPRRAATDVDLLDRLLVGKDLVIGEH